mgnify:CR=1 FL=1
MSRVLIAIIRWYQRYISPYTPPSCRFKPTCSHYGIEAIRLHGAFKGSFMTLWRILRCNPFCKGGFDPVPMPKRFDEGKKKGEKE